jgi:hypothetical protein
LDPEGFFVAAAKATRPGGVNPIHFSGGTQLMQPFLVSLPTLAVAVIYCFWNGYRVSLARRERALRHRVAYMLWVMADQMP